MIIKIPAFVTLAKVNRYTKSSLNHSVDCSLAADLTGRVSHLLACMHGLSRVQPTVRSTGLNTPSQVTKFKINSFIFFQRMHISPNKKTFIQIFSTIFLKFSGKGATPQPLQTINARVIQSNTPFYYC